MLITIGVHGSSKGALDTYSMPMLVLNGGVNKGILAVAMAVLLKQYVGQL